MKFKSVLSKLGFLMSHLPALLLLWTAIEADKERYKAIFEQDPLLASLYAELQTLYNGMKK